MGAFNDRQILEALEGEQKCTCCGIEPISPEAVDVLDGEVICIDCMECYHSEVYLHRVEHGY